MCSESRIELEEGYQFQQTTLVDRCMLGAACGIIFGMAVFFFGEFKGWW
mgnify:CR=1 FL=1